ncbi:hypothetical protein CAPTEDRAFT_146129 [Capitella teleta]|uniref:DAGKc domain-containing protein n=1 Tax=Capitella teleta TaxID=283909 RepID=R7TVD6_CAPTE|nr:hypothetical protein CAPTEDRAFT_146129 [Capitella teleta]|eukprot:ELT94980.1 hypothetical protein CAPTEDRAFT_146129 [Capitella teleta]
MVSLNPTAFTLWVVKRCRKHRWRERKVTFLSKDTSVIQQWVDILHEALSKPEFCRPRNLLVFVNPVGGKGHATRIYSKRVAPIFELAGVSTEVVTTNHQNHARDTLRDYDLAKFDGIVSIGGDGMFTEIVHGLMARTLADSDVEQLTPETVLPQPTIRIGIIPAGSTDTVAWTTCGTKDATTAAIHIVIGDDTAIDLGICFSGNRFIKYNVSMMAYGYYGDCIVDSEANRWMGPKRYDWEGFKKLLANKSYEGELTYLPCPDKENHPRDGTHCKAGCSVCSAAPVAEAEPDNNPSQSLQGWFAFMYNKGWQKVKGRFIGINAFVMSCRCRFAPEGPAPCAHLGDGCIDLIVIHECSRVDYMRHLFRCMDPKKDQFDFPFIQAIRCRDFKFRPITDDLEDAHDSGVEGQQRLRSRTSCLSVWNCDGEVVEEPSIDYRIHRKMIRLFARGVEDEISETSNGCLNCAGRN